MIGCETVAPHHSLNKNGLIIHPYGNKTRSPTFGSCSTLGSMTGTRPEDECGTQVNRRRETQVQRVITEEVSQKLFLNWTFSHITDQLLSNNSDLLFILLQRTLAALTEVLGQFSP